MCRYDETDNSKNGDWRDSFRHQSPPYQTLKRERSSSKEEHRKTKRSKTDLHYNDDSYHLDDGRTHKDKISIRAYKDYEYFDYLDRTPTNKFSSDDAKRTQGKIKEDPEINKSDRRLSPGKSVAKRRSENRHRSRSKSPRLRIKKEPSVKFSHHEFSPGTDHSTARRRRSSSRSEISRKRRSRTPKRPRSGDSRTEEESQPRPRSRSGSSHRRRRPSGRDRSRSTSRVEHRRRQKRSPLNCRTKPCRKEDSNVYRGWEGSREGRDAPRRGKVSQRMRTTDSEFKLGKKIKHETENESPERKQKRKKSKSRKSRKSRKSKNSHRFVCIYKSLKNAGEGEVKCKVY